MKLQNKLLLITILPIMILLGVIIFLSQHNLRTKP